MTRKERYKKVIQWFEENMPLVKTELIHRNPYELLVAVILSAQCTDKRVNKITPEFFKSFPTANELAKADIETVYEHIKTCSYPNNKAKHLVGMAKMLVGEFNNVVPDNVEDLQKLPGVGRKTANVIASIVYDKPVIAVDTHVFRLSARLGLTKSAKTPLEAEKQLTKYIPGDKRAIAHHWLILHGRYVCLARKPKCDICGLRPCCLYYSTHNKPQIKNPPE